MEEEGIKQHTDPLPRSPLSTIILCYLLPVISLSLWAHYAKDSWSILSFGLFLSAFGTVVLYIVLNKTPSISELPEELIPPPKPAETIPLDCSPYINQIQILQKQVQDQALQQADLQSSSTLWQEKYQAEIHAKEIFQKQLASVQEELQHVNESSQRQLEQHQQWMAGQQKTINELRESLEGKHRHILQLEAKTRDLNYELKTLLKLAERPIEAEPSPEKGIALASVNPQNVSAPLQDNYDDPAQIFDFAVRTPEEAHVHLKRILDVAQRITGASPFGSSPRFRDLPLDNYALDLRRLFDRLKEINASAILVFSLKENKILFVNEAVRALVGIAPEKFMQSFHELVQEKSTAWPEAVRQLAFKNESKVSLSFKNRQGQELTVDGLLGAVPTGMFKNHLIGILYQQKV